MKRLYSILIFILLILTSLSFFGGVVYRVYALNTLGVLISLAFSFIFVFYAFRLFQRKNIASEKMEKFDWKNPFFLLYLIFAALSFCILLRHETVRAIVSPWQVVPAYFFFVYGSATLFLFVFLTKVKNGLSAILLLSVHYFLSFSVALIVYKIGYGFDPFVHEATLKLIDKIGSVNPKQFYYLGFYGPITIIHKFLRLPISFLNKFSVPLLSALFLPFFSWRAFRGRYKEKNLIFIVSLLLLIIPYSFLILSTPQNLAFLILLLIILISLDKLDSFNLLLINFLALAALITQPIAGIPAFLYGISLAVFHGRIKRKKLFYSIIFIISVFALPLAFLFVENDSFNLNFSFHFPRIVIPGSENFIYNFIYLLGFNFGIIFFVSALAGIFIALKNREKFKILFLNLGIAVALFVSYILSTFLNFNYLISYERDNYSDRILKSAALFLLPFVAIVFYELTKRILNSEKKIQIPFAIFLILLVTASLYLSYPRYDNYFNSKGLSTGADDINAVRLIEYKGGKNYIALADQQVSAAALNEFGFSKYYKNNIFYYPVPTSGPLYQYYLDMVYKNPSRATMLQAMNLAGVNEGFFVLNKYWTDFVKIRDEAKLSSDKWWSIGNGDVYVFEYKR